MSTNQTNLSHLPKEIMELYNNSDLVNTMIKLSIDKVIENFQEWKEYSPFSDKPDKDDDYTIVNIYIIKDKSLSLVCVNGFINLDFCYFSEYGNKREKEFSLLLTHKLNSRTKMKTIYDNIYDIYQELTNKNPYLECCERCKKCFYNKNTRGQVITNVCQSCEPSLFLCLKGILMSSHECNICFTKFLDENNNKYSFKTLYSINCCKGKISCIDCLQKLKKNCNRCSPLSENCADIECPFCKQCLQVSKIYR